MSYLDEWERASAQHPQWTTRVEVDFLNALCPSTGRSFPVVPGTEHVTGELSRVFEEAFRYYQDFWRSDLIHTAGRCGKGEMQVLLAIERKTLGFGKLMEKLPRRLLTQGEVNPRTGRPRLRPNGVPILPATGIHNRNLGRCIDGLLTKQLITRVPSDEHPRYGASAVYSPARIDAALSMIFERARAIAAAAADASTLMAAIDLLVDPTNEALSSLMSDMVDESELDQDAG